MPHATSVPFTGFQALILCGPGVSLNTFTANPDEFPKALVPIGNRPMVWYPLDWCYRMGISKIHLVTPNTSLKALEAALSQNPFLTSLPSPKADILAPAELTHTTPTAEILRLPEVQAAVTGDFLILPCDLICELPGENLLETWLIQQASVGGGELISSKSSSASTLSRRGGLSVYYETRSGASDYIKGAETDFVITTAEAVPRAVTPCPSASLRPHVRKFLYATTTDTLKDILDDEGGFPIRPGLIRRHGKIRMRTTHRDAHIYLFPRWVMRWVKDNPKFDSISEDVVGWWAKVGWQEGLGEKLRMRDAMDAISSSSLGKKEVSSQDPNDSAGKDEEKIDVASLSSTTVTNYPSGLQDHTAGPNFHEQSSPPPMLAYIHPSSASSPAETSNTSSGNTNSKASSTTTDDSAIITSNPLIRRVDTPHLLLRASLYIASLPTPTEVANNATTTFTASGNKARPQIQSQQSQPPQSQIPNPLSHLTKIDPSTVPLIAAHTTIHSTTVLIGSNTTIQTHVTIKNSVIGSNCRIEAGAKINGSLLMDGAVVGEKANLQGCIVGRRAVVGKAAALRECEIQEGFLVEEGLEAKGEKMSVFEGLDGDDDGDGDGDDAE